MPLSPDLQAKVDQLRRTLEAAAYPQTIEYAATAAKSWSNLGQALPRR